MLMFVPQAAAGDIPFTDGPGSAKKIAAALNRDRSFNDITCRYRAPLIRCKGYARWGRSDSYLAATITVHKTAPRRGYMMLCVKLYGACTRSAMTFSR